VSYVLQGESTPEQGSQETLRIEIAKRRKKEKENG